MSELDLAGSVMPHPIVDTSKRVIHTCEEYLNVGQNHKSKGHIELQGDI